MFLDFTGGNTLWPKMEARDSNREDAAAVLDESDVDVPCRSIFSGVPSSSLSSLGIISSRDMACLICSVSGEPGNPDCNFA